MADITVPVPDNRVADFYQFFGLWLASPPGSPPGPPHADADGPGGDDEGVWENTPEDLELAKEVWGKFSGPARDLFTVLMDHPGEGIDAETLAALAGIEKGKYGIAGVLSWPRRHCGEVGRWLPLWSEPRNDGKGSTYYMGPQTSALFKKAAAA